MTEVSRILYVSRAVFQVKCKAWSQRIRFFCKGDSWNELFSKIPWSNVWWLQNLQLRQKRAGVLVRKADGMARQVVPGMEGSAATGTGASRSHEKFKVIYHSRGACSAIPSLGFQEKGWRRKGQTEFPKLASLCAMRESYDNMRKWGSTTRRDWEWYLD